MGAYACVAKSCSLGKVVLELTTMSQGTWPHLDKYQTKRLEEMLIVVDENDQVIGTESKMNCHLNKNIEKGLLHRGFSVVLFSTENKLLLQQRAETKFTYPGCFSDSCSSHPLYEPLEMEESHAIGMKRAAKQRLHAELGIPQEQISLDDILFVTRLHYKLPITELLGEHEIGYLLFVRKDVTLNPDPKEIKDHIYVTKEELKNLLEQETKDKPKFTGWFHLIAKFFLFNIWDNLHDLNLFVEPDKIHRAEKHV
ncbi:isopentenyl-diphosphate Delta-isomerase 1-like isoform X1 [Petaurus breviceps papuanus]|uniref:isopentenyl-diphosphate Delta-isomerase 1-like isoform X1 n=2 Tax=Petaurus breviceps papuanus TaxID=3040969 RepID=UPI0036DF5FD6